MSEPTEASNQPEGEPEGQLEPQSADQLEPEPPDQPGGPGFVRRNRLSLAACVVAVISLAIAIGVLAANSGGSTSAAVATPGGTSAAAAAPSAAATSGKPASGSGHASAKRATRATIVTESGTSWTVRTAKGETVNVTITPQTQFGTPKAPATQSQFSVGANVVITGTVANGTATATRVAAAPAGAATVSPVSPAPPTAADPTHA